MPSKYFHASMTGKAPPEIGRHLEGFCPACGYSHDVMGEHPLADDDPMSEDTSGSYQVGPACRGCGYCHGGDIGYALGGEVPRNLNATVNDPDEERKRYMSALRRAL